MYNFLKKILFVSNLFCFSFIATDFAVGQEENSYQISDSSVERFLNAAKLSNSDAFLISQNDKIVTEYYASEEKLIETMSVTKLIVAIGVGKLLYENKIDSLDQPVYSFYPEWKQGRKKDITIRHLMNHTSGMQNILRTTEEIYPSPDIVKLALSAELESEPGSEVSYNNKAVNLLAGLFERASGERMDKYFENNLFNELGIKEYEWAKDKAGNPYAMSGLKLKASDLIKFGQLVLDKGEWDGVKIISEGYLNEMLGKEKGGGFGLLWRKIPESSSYILREKDLRLFEDKGVSKEYIEKLKPYVNVEIQGSEIEKIYIEIFKSPETLHKEFTEKGVIKIFESNVGKTIGYYGDGDLGQYLIVLPHKDLVVVRQKMYSEDYNMQTDMFRDILDRVRSL